MKSLADISQTRRPKGQRIAKSSRKKVSRKNRKKNFRKSMENLEKEVLAMDDVVQRDEVLIGNSPDGWTLWPSFEGPSLGEERLLLVRQCPDGEWEAKEPILEFLEQTFQDSISTSVFGKVYLNELAFELQKKLRAMLFKLTPPSPVDNYALLSTLTNAMCISEGFFMAIFSRPPNS